MFQKAASPLTKTYKYTNSPKFSEILKQTNIKTNKL